MPQKALPTKHTAATVLAQLFSPPDLKILAKKAQVVLLVGLPGSGKSTISELLVSCYGYWRFSSDQIRMEELFPDQKHRVASEHVKVMAARQFVYQELQRRVVEALKRGQRIVVDSTNLDDKRDVLLDGIKKVVPAEAIALVNVQTPESILKARFEKEGDESAKAWHELYQLWQTYVAEGKAKFPTQLDYPGVNICPVQRYDLETFDWITDIGVLVWDVDKTLYKSVPAVQAAVQKYTVQVIAKHRKLTFEEAERLLEKTFAEKHSHTMALDSFGLDGRAVIDHAFSKIDFKKHLKPDPRLKELFEKLHQFHHVILTNSSKRATERKLKALGLPLKIFSAIYATYDLPVVKPDKKVFLHVIKQTSFAPHQHLMIGDELHTDILPAQSVGMRTALIGKEDPAADVAFTDAYKVGRLFGVEV